MATPRNYWPLGVMLAFAIFIPFTVGLVVMACWHKEELVRADYYEQELQYQRHLERVDSTRSLRSPATVVFDVNRQCIRIELPAEHSRQDPQGHIQLYRPSAAGLDQELKLALGADGLQTIDAKALRPGLWKIRVFWTVDHREYFLDQAVVVSPKPSHEPLLL